MTADPINVLRILVVEDEMLVAMFIKDMLKDLGCDVIGPAANVEQALSLIQSAGVIDAAVLDVNLNGCKSYPVADELAQRNIPFVFATGYEKRSLPSQYISTPFLQKPFTEGDLKDSLIQLTTA